MITLNELNPRNHPTNETIDLNLDTLRQRLNEFEQKSGFLFVITSGLRSPEEQLIINPRASKTSKHMIGAAADIEDRGGQLAEWVKANLPWAEEVGLWFEDFNSTHGWVHAQIVPPFSGHRVFLP